MAPAKPAHSAADLPKGVVFATAGLGGVLGWLVVHPFNLLAVRMNLSAKGGKMPSMVQVASNVVRNEGILGLYSGLGAGITRQVFYATSRFGLYEIFRDTLAQYRETDVFSRLLVGGISGGCAAFISCPAEVSLVRMSNDATLPAAERRNYKSVVDAFARIPREEGVRAFWRGSMPFVNRAILVGVCQVATYDQFRQMFHNAGLRKGEFSNTFAASMAAGLFYSAVTMPLESAKNKMAFQKSSGPLQYTGTIQTIRAIAKSDGVLSLWSGFLPYYGRCGGHTVAMFVAVEKLREWYWKYYVGE